MRLALSALTVAALLCSTPAICETADPHMIYSYPKAGGTEREPVRFVQVGFGNADADIEVDLLFVEIVNPDETKIEVYNASTNDFPRQPSAMIALTLRAPLTTPGDYRINYVFKSAQEVSPAGDKSGSFNFTLDLPETESAGESGGSGTDDID